MSETNAALQTSLDGFHRLHQQLSEVLGRQTVDVLVDRAALEIGVAHPGMSGIRLVNGRLNLDHLEQTFADATPEQIRAGFDALNAVVVLILARLVGSQMAEGIASRVDAVQTRPAYLNRTQP